MPTVTVAGVGVIGLSWARLFADHRWNVIVTDPREDVAEVVQTAALADAVQVEADPQRAVAEADLVQECGPERLELKQTLFDTCARAAPSTAIFASSSSSLLPSSIAQDNAAADRILIAHPFNPPHLMPLVELVPGQHTSSATLETARDIYQSLGKVPVRLHKEIPGFVGNRLQKALNTEASYLVEQDVIEPGDLDTLVTSSLGLRWATIGPFEARHLGGGPGGIRHLVDNVSSQMDFPLGEPDPALQEKVFDEVEHAYGTGETAYEQRARRRDRLTRDILATRAAAATENREDLE